MAQARSDYIELQQVPRPVGNYILIKRGEVEDSTTAGGIILPDSSRRLDNSGEVIALGEQSRITKKGYKSYLIFLVQIENMECFKIARDIDNEYYKNYINAKKAGVNFLAYACKINTKEIKIKKKLKIINE